VEKITLWTWPVMVMFLAMVLALSVLLDTEVLEPLRNLKFWSLFVTSVWFKLPVESTTPLSSLTRVTSTHGVVALKVNLESQILSK
jgi:hypothetical protein